MNVTVIDDRTDRRPLPESSKLAELVIRAERLPDSTEVTVVFVDAADMAERNLRHMGKVGSTDVLSFPIEEMVPGRTPAWETGGPPFLLGDVFICPEVVEANAAEAGVPFEDEFSLMVVHGLLHLMGYDHEDDADAEVMEERERQLLGEVGRTRP